MTRNQPKTKSAAPGREIYKSDRVIHMGTQGGKITASLYRCVNAIILSTQHHVQSRYDTLEEFEAAHGDTILNIEVPFKNFADYMGWKSNNRKKAIEAIQLLESLKVKWDIIHEDDENAVDVGFLSFVPKARVVDGMMQFSLTPDVRRELLNIDKNPQAHLNLMIANAAWSDKYTALLYEKCTLELTNNSVAFELSIDQLRSLFNIEYTLEAGERKYKYPQFRELKRNVISKAVDNINKTEILDFYIEVTPIGKPVRAVHFAIMKKRRSESQMPMLEVNTRKQLLNALQGSMLMESVLQHFAVQDFDDLTDYQVFYTEYCLNTLNEKLDAGGVKNVFQYFMTILRSNEKAFAVRWIQIEKQLKNQARQVHIEREQRRHQVSTEVHKKYRDEVYRDFIATVDVDKLDRLHQQAVEKIIAHNPGARFKRMANSDTSLPVHQQLDWTHPINVGMFKEYVLDHLIPDKLSQKQINKRIEEQLVKK
ncbi:hypothetical protein AT705_24655 (plasmid) [Pseudoalteromonas rubra]|uniref:Initiator Rep protein WH1 domain-containing protein n=1 Tax=Pseudoalteromonas rubra TaxID=43658 RepID=A0A0U2PGC1_9GAMM|nr:hypothetical protein AT705_24655 [Pseudoalteromonas rubra]